VPAIETDHRKAAKQVVPACCSNHHENTCLLEHGVFLVKNTQVEAAEDEIDQNCSDRVEAAG